MIKFDYFQDLNTTVLDNILVLVLAITMMIVVLGVLFLVKQEGIISSELFLTLLVTSTL
jgi:hypothetical protein